MIYKQLKVVLIKGEGNEGIGNSWKSESGWE